MSATPGDRRGLRNHVRYLPGVGPLADSLSRLQLHTVQDVLFFLPRRYEPATPVRTISDLEEDAEATICAHVDELEGRTTQTGKHMLCALFHDGTDWLRGIWYNQPYVQQRLRVGQRVAVTGRPKMNGLRWEMTHPQIGHPADFEDASLPALRPVYRLTESLKQYRMRRIAAAAVDRYAELVPEVLPPAVRDRGELIGITEAIRQIHAPHDEQQLAAARRRFVFQELLLEQLAFAYRRRQLLAGRQAIPIAVSPQIDARILRRFPFELTPGQQQVIGEIVGDIARTVPMSRLLHGEVGSGKTVVAIYLILAAIAAGCQVVLMAPTEVLAAQHHETLQLLLQGARVRQALWTGAVRGQERTRLRAQIAAGELDLIVGTQALVESDIPFARLAAVIVDEQHRFGVRQRAWLTHGDREPHYLVMTATPIPRTMALLAYGDLDVSTLRETPGCRSDVKTYLVEETRRDRWWDFFRRQLRAGRQGYVVVPRVTADESERLSGLDELLESLCHEELADFRVHILHGRMKSQEKLAAMQSFRQGRAHVLLATSVVEIGIDVPNAVVMTIYNADRFGLAQLHQLRGRVSRGVFSGYVALFSDAPSPDAVQRLETFQATTDGFALSELDLQRRGPGELFGTRQHGAPEFRVARLPQDEPILLETRALADWLLQQDPQLERPEHELIRRRVLTRYGRSLALGNVG